VTPGWAAELAGDGCADSTWRAVRLAASAWVTPDRIRDAVAHCLGRAAAVTAEEVLGVLEAQAGEQLVGDPHVAKAGRRLLAHNATVRIVGQPGYPQRLGDAWPELGAPVWVFVTGAATRTFDAPAVAVVGTRQPSLDGAQTARELAALLARHGVTVVSGMARGIDQAAHLGAIDGRGRTVAVLGTGFGVDYPRHDGPVRDAVAANGALVTELLPGTQPQKRAFLWRNRIISGLTDLTVVVEGRARSGALHTARMAAAQGRDVMAVPGSVHAATSRAPLDLIRDGALAVTRLDDVLVALGLTGAPVSPGARAAQLAFPTSLTDAARQVLALLGAVPAPPHTLCAATQLPVPTVLAAVAELTGHGLAVGTPRGVVRSRPDTS
jgi:DNA processing protein